MKIDHLKEFIALANAGSFARAAEALYISQSALSRHIKALEDELGVRLLERDTHSVRLTEAGAVWLEGAKGIVDSYGLAMGKLSDHLHGIAGELHIGMLYYAIDAFMPPILSRCRESYPGIALRLSSYQPEGLYNDLKAGLVDLALVCYEHLDEPEIEARPFAEEGVVATVSSTHPLAARDEIEPEELAGCDLARLSSTSGMRIEADYDRALSSIGIGMRELDGFTNVDLLPALVRDQGCVVVNPASMARMPAHDVRMIPVRGLKTVMHFAYLRSNRNPVLDLFLSIVDEVYKPGPGASDPAYSKSAIQGTGIATP